MSYCGSPGLLSVASSGWDSGTALWVCTDPVMYCSENSLSFGTIQHLAKSISDRVLEDLLDPTMESVQKGLQLCRLEVPLSMGVEVEHE